MAKDTLQDGRIPGFYIVDNELIDNYGSTIGVYGVAIYNVLAKYANEKGSSIFPSYQTIADALGISRPKVIGTIKILVDAGLVKKTARVDSAGDMTSNHYVLVSLKGGKPQIPPSKQDLPPSKQEQPRVVNDVNQGGKPRLPDQDPVNKTQLNKTTATQADAIAQPSVDTSAKKAKREQSPEDKERVELTKAILAAYVEVHGRNGISYGKEGKAAKQLASEGRTPEQVRNCYLWLKAKPFWSDKPLSLVTLGEWLPEYEKYLEKTKPSPGKSKNGAPPEGWRITTANLYGLPEGKK